MQRPDWLNTSLYPFTSRWMDLEEGRMHYVDEGSGSVLLLVHGTPTSSILWRDLIRVLASRHRVIAIDHLGYGLSDKPADAGYRPADHARRLAHFIEALGLRDIALGVHDFGGPIGLSYAIAHPANVTRLVLSTTWMWSLRGNATAERASRLLGGRFGRFLYTRLNFSPKVLLKAGYADKSRLTAEIHRHYTAPFPNAGERIAPWILAGELVGSSDWYDQLWQQRERIADKPALVLWGMKDPAFGEAYLERWESALQHAEVHRIADAGHFVSEEAGATVAQRVGAFLSHTGSFVEPST
jgi:pimeloyl-ACP methyl ester carboxylesterase